MLSPQQYAAPASVNAHACSFPTLSDRKTSPPETGTGVLLGVVEPFPNWPTSLLLQQYALPSAFRPQAWLKPVTTETNGPTDT